jgi:hypothetical protein
MVVFSINNNLDFKKYTVSFNVIFTSKNVAKIGKNGPKIEFFDFFDFSLSFTVSVNAF